MSEKYPYEFNGERVRFIYMRDAKTPQRRATVAYVKTDDKLRYSWALNRSDDRKNVDPIFGYEVMTDTFSKAAGRKIATGRLNSNDLHVEIDAPKEGRYIDTIVNHIASFSQDGWTVPGVLAAIAKAELAKRGK